MISQALDDIDIKILNVLLKDARISVPELVKSIGISEDNIKYRMTNLLAQKIINYFTIDINFNHLTDLPYYFIMIQTELQNVDYFISEISTFDEIRQIHMLCQNTKLLLVTFVLPIQKIHELLQKLRKYPCVKDIEPWMVSNTLMDRPDFIPNTLKKVVYS